ncbi:MAG: cytochrome c oxidase assembly protein [Thermoleophilaceae bacterium]
MSDLHLGEAVPPIAAMIGWSWLYRRRCRTLASRGRPVPGWRKACFYAGALVIVVALVSPVDRVAEKLLYVHMVQHLLLGDIAALLIALSLTGPLIQPILRVRPFQVIHTLSHPLVAFPLWALDLYVWHLPVLYEAALRSDLVHALQHLMFFAFGLNMWLPLVGALPVPEWFGFGARLGYVTAVRFTGALLGNVFIFSGSVFYGAYAAGEAQYGIRPLEDQTIAGSIMMIEGMILTVCLFGWLFIRAADAGEKRQELLELAAANHVELSEQRAARAVAAGRDEELRRRLLAGDAGEALSPPGAG